MTLGELKKHIESLPDNSKFDYTLCGPFSWRGSYNEVAFAIAQEPSNKEEILETINEAYSCTFRGYKGGEFKYNDWTEVHFEEDYSSYTDGEYCRILIEEIEKRKQYVDNETKLVNLIFK